VMDVFRVMGLA